MRLKGPALIIVLVVAGVIGAFFGIGLGARAADSPIALLIMIVIFVGLIAFVIAALASNRKVANASAEERAAALAFTPPPGKALLYCYRQGFMGKARGCELALDGRTFASIKSPRFTCVAIAPGPHRLTAWFAGVGGTAKRPGAAEFTAIAGEVRAFRMEMVMGLVTGAIEPTEVLARDAAPALQGIAMVRPDIAEL